MWLRSIKPLWSQTGNEKCVCKLVFVTCYQIGAKWRTSNKIRLKYRQLLLSGTLSACLHWKSYETQVKRVKFSHKVLPTKLNPSETRKSKAEYKQTYKLTHHNVDEAKIELIGQK